MSHKCNMPELLDVHIWGEYANVYATQDITAIKTVVCGNGYIHADGQSMIAKADSPNQL